MALYFFKSTYFDRVNAEKEKVLKELDLFLNIKGDLIELLAGTKKDFSFH